MDVPAVAGLALIGVEFWLLGLVTALDWPGQTWAIARVALRVLVGSTLIAVAQLLLALIGVGFANVPLVLVAAFVLAGLLRAVAGFVRAGLLRAVAGFVRAALLRAVARFVRAVLLRRAAATFARAPLLAPNGASEARRPAPERAELLGWLLLALVLLGATLRALVVPEAGWDAYSHWGLRAQAYAQAGTIVNAGSEHEYYPPLVPLLEAWLYLHVGQPSIDLGKTVWALLGSCFAICLAWHLRLVLRPTWLGPVASAAIVASVTSLLEGFWTGQADLPLAAWLTLSALAAWRYSRGFDPRWLMQMAIFAAAAGLTKLEGTPRVLILALTVLVLARSVKTATALGVPALAAIALWTLAAQRAGIAANSEHLGAFQLPYVLPVLVALAQTFAGVRTGGILVIAIAAWLVARQHLPRMLVAVTLGQLAFTLLAFLLSDTDPATEVATSATRLFAQWLPIALVAAAVALRKTF